jgi:hypothetical protein
VASPKPGELVGPDIATGTALRELDGVDGRPDSGTTDPAISRGPARCPSCARPAPPRQPPQRPRRTWRIASSSSARLLSFPGAYASQELSQELHVTYEEPLHPLRTAHPSFIVDDLAALVARLRAAGPAATPDEMIPGRERAFVHDPFGNRLELRQA